jgi:hypothetical protein
MRSYLLIESRSDQESPDVLATRALAARLSRRGHEVVLYLTDNGVLVGGGTPEVAELVQAGVQVWLDDVSLRLRLAGPPSPPLAGTRLSGMQELVTRLMTPGVCPVWH